MSLFNFDKKKLFGSMNNSNILNNNIKGWVLDVNNIQEYASKKYGFTDESSFYEYLQKKLFPQVLSRAEADMDYVLLITGAERSGKSNVAIKVAHAFHEYVRAYIRKYIPDYPNIEDYEPFTSTEVFKKHMGISVQDALPILKKRSKDLIKLKEEGYNPLPYCYIIDEGAMFYSKWRQTTKESYEVFLIYRLTGYMRMFWILLYQNLADAGELFLTGRANNWFYTFLWYNPRIKKEQRGLIVFPEWKFRQIVELINTSRKFKKKISLYHYYPKKLISYLLGGLQNLGKCPVKCFTTKFEYWDVYDKFKMEYNKKRIELLEDNLYGRESYDKVRDKIEEMYILLSKLIDNPLGVARLKKSLSSVLDLKTVEKIISYVSTNKDHQEKDLKYLFNIIKESNLELPIKNILSVVKKCNNEVERLYKKLFKL